MIKKINLFISYRRGDGSGEAGRIFDRLKEEFNVFFDTDSIRGGDDFPDEIKKGIEKSKIILFIVGENSCKEFKNRLSGTDYVVQEIAYAHELNINAIPILINNAKMPTTDCLPPEIHFLSGKNACSIEHIKFDQDIDHLIDEIILSVNKKIFLVSKSQTKNLIILKYFFLNHIVRKKLYFRMLHH
ncbi:MAG TPA: toll/interleukin-1 receptor domain-containing protein [Campylobacterales bacterium]|nr:toll/interleukin-1 receptor domain-containing protein [Campylobacterales bacterium]